MKRMCHNEVKTSMIVETFNSLYIIVDFVSLVPSWFNPFSVFEGYDGDC